MLGADGMNMGARFPATREVLVHDRVKAATVVASKRDTRLVMRLLRNTERVLANPAFERVLAEERRLGDALTFGDIAAEVACVYPHMMRDGDTDAGLWSCGMVAGLIDDVPSVSEMIDRIMAQADQIISGRLTQPAA